MLLCGRARGVQVGPSGSSTYFERLRWATQDSPPNIVTLLARVAGQDKKPILATSSPVTPQQRSSTPVHAIHSPVPISPEIAERMRVNRLAALQRLNASSPFGPSQALSSLVPTTPSPATFSPLVSTPSPSLPETPQTQLVQRVPSGFLPCARSTPSQSKTTTPLQVTPPTMQRPIALVEASAQQQHRSVTTPPLNPYTFFT